MGRIELLAWADDDLWAVERFLGDPEMMRHLGGAQSRQQILDQHARFLDAEKSGTGVMFKVVLRDTLGAIGNVGYWDTTWQDELVYETGWMTLPEYQGRGYASEALEMLVTRLRREHARRFLHAFPAITNGPSNALCRKAGFTNLGQVEVEYPPGRPMQCNNWRLDLSRTPDRPNLGAESVPTYHRSDR